MNRLTRLLGCIQARRNRPVNVIRGDQIVRMPYKCARSGDILRCRFCSTPAVHVDGFAPYENDYTRCKRHKDTPLPVKPQPSRSHIVGTLIAHRIAEGQMTPGEADDIIELFAHYGNRPVPPAVWRLLG